MCFIDDHEIEGAQFAGPAVDGLDARHEDRCVGVPSVESGGVDADADLGTDAANLVGILFEQLFDVRQD